MYRRLLRVLDHFEEIIGCTVLVVMVVLLVIQVTLRYIFNTAISQAEEISRYCLIWMAFIGASYGAKKRTHVEMGFLVDLLIPSKTIKRWYQAMVDLIIVVIFLLLLPESIKFIILQMNSTSPTIPQLSLAVVYVILPVGIALMGLRYAVHIINGIRGKKDVEKQLAD